MNIQKEIQQKKFQNNLQKALVNIMFTSNWVVRKITKMLKPFGITHQQYNVLRVLAGKCPEPISMGEIKQVMLDKTPDLTRIVERLIIKELAERQVCKSNRRKVEVMITAKGLKLVETIKPESIKAFKGVLNLSEGEAEVLSRLLDKMRN